MLVVGIDPMGPGANPTNANFILRDTNHFFSSTAIAPRSVSFSFSGIGTSSNIWHTVTDTIAGAVYIGNLTSTGIFSSNFVAYELYISMLVEFNNPM
jgi:hypothetical protein